MTTQGLRRWKKRQMRFGAKDRDWVVSHEKISLHAKTGIPKIGIGDNCEILKAIIDNNARVGNGVKLINMHNVAQKEAENYVGRLED